jgi:hypothetical protein
MLFGISGFRYVDAERAVGQEHKAQASFDGENRSGEEMRSPPQARASGQAASKEEAVQGRCPTPTSRMSQGG